MGWTDKYSKKDMELIIDELLWFTMSRRYDDYSEGWMEADEVLNFLKECGFADEDAREICQSNGIDLEGSDE